MSTTVTLAGMRGRAIAAASVAGGGAREAAAQCDEWNIENKRQEVTRWVYDEFQMKKLLKVFVLV